MNCTHTEPSRKHNIVNRIIAFLIKTFIHRTVMYTCQCTHCHSSSSDTSEVFDVSDDDDTDTSS
jgi:hypothetical protein